MSGNLVDPYYDGILPTVEKPSRYIGRELNYLSTGFRDGGFNVLLAFPDVYEIGMSYQGIHTLYRKLASSGDTEVEFVFAPWPDMEKRLIDCGERLRSLQTGTPADKFDLIGFSLTYELHYTNFLMMLRLVGIPYEASKRTEKDPLVIAGGACCMNPLPILKSIDAIFLGDGEESLAEAVNVLKKLNNSGAVRDEKKEELSRIEGVYVDGFSSSARSRIYSIPAEKKFRPPYKLPEVVPSWKPLVPSSKIVHERLVVEVQRGCSRGCRFCQAGMLYRPCRERSVDGIVRAVIEGLDASGWEEVSLLSLSTSDYSKIDELIGKLTPELRRRNVSLALPSLRPETITDKIIEALSLGKRSGFTIAPEAGTERLRKIINRKMSNEEIIDSSRRIIESGWRTLKLYFMIGLPTETEEDLDGIVDLINEILMLKKRGKFRLNVTISPFVPKAHTPFQWERQCDIEEFTRKERYLSRHLRDRRLNLRLRNPAVSVLEGILARGDSSLWPVLLQVVEKGGRFEGWSDYFNFDIWEEALKNEGIDFRELISEIPLENSLPWKRFESTVNEEFLRRERKNGYAGKLTEDCRGGKCTDCGVCDDMPGIRDRNFVKTVKDSGSAVGSEGSEPSEVIENHTGGLFDGKQSVVVTSEDWGGGNKNPAFRFRCVFSKTGNARFLSHRELVDIIRRALGRTGLPVNVSEGFHPQIRLSIAPPLSVGMEGENEFFDFELKEKVDIVPSIFRGFFPQGIEIKRCVGPFSKKKGKLPVESLFHYYLDFETLRFVMKKGGNGSKYLSQGRNVWYSLKDSLNLTGEEKSFKNWLTEDPASGLKKKWSEMFSREEKIENRRGKVRSVIGCQVENVRENVLGLKLPASGGAGITPGDLLNIYLPGKLTVLVKISRKGLYY
ncbi:TIGR03960 family B12-binding radical SAM protein, partial [bacterium]|nr:TIGR03960 family B12-binding radical SAM protein [bacterium]